MIQETNRKRDELRWLSGFAVFGSLLVLPGLLPVVKDLNLDADPSQAGLRFFAFDAGFLLASALCQSVLKKFSLRTVVIVGLLLSAVCLLATLSLSALVPFWWHLFPAFGIGIGGGLVAISSLSALKPWSSRLGAHALPRVVEFVTLGCIFSCLAAALAYQYGWVRLFPLPLCAAVFLCLTFVLAGRHPLAVIGGRPSTIDSQLKHHRSIAAFLLISLLFVQLGSEWSVAGWLPLFLIHRLGWEPSAAILVLAAFFGALFGARILTQRTAPRFTSRSLAICGTVLSLAGCLLLTFSTSRTGISIGLAALALGFAPPYSVVKSVLDESFQFTPGFYQGMLTVAVTGATFVPWLLGYVHQLFGLAAVSLFPAAASIVVLIVELLLMFESHLMSERAPARPDLPTPTADRRTS